MSLLVLAFPVIDPENFNLIQSWRKDNDELFGIVDPHFTLVFAVDDMTEDEFIKEIETQSRGVRKIEFEIKKAIVHKDEFKEYYHEFLVPGKGWDEIVALHDSLYTGILLPHWRKDIEYIPHITIGNSKNKMKCEKDIDELNVAGIFMNGSIESLSIVEYSNGIVKTVKELRLE